MTAYLGYIHAGTTAKLDQLIPVRDFTITEFRNGGWLGEANVDLPLGTAPSIESTFKFTIGRGLAAGASMGVRLVPVSGTDVRSWPSVIMAVDTIEGVDATKPGFRVRFCDPLTMISDQCIWAVFKDAALGRIVGGAMALAANGNGLPTYTPVLPGLPRITVTERVHSVVSPLSFAIAAGAPLGDWLADLLARLGARLEVTGRIDGTVHVHVTDSRPTGTPIHLNLGASLSGTGSGSGAGGGSSLGSGSGGSSGARLVSMGAYPITGKSAAVVDNLIGTAYRYGSLNGVSRVIDAMDLKSPHELRRRSLFASETSLMESTGLLIGTATTALKPGARVRFPTKITGNQQWQATETLHVLASDTYRNVCKLYKDGLAWRGTVREQAGDGVFVSAVVDDGTSAEGAPVSRDRQGRIPVRFSFLASPGNSAVSASSSLPTAGSSSGSSMGSGSSLGSLMGSSTGSSLGSASLPRRPTPHTGDVIHLPIIEPMGSGQHGFIPAHRQGDQCRISVRSPLFAEIIGFAYRENKPVPNALMSATAGLLVGHGASGWAGVMFRPEEDTTANGSGSGGQSGTTTTSNGSGS